MGRPPKNKTPDNQDLLKAVQALSKKIDDLEEGNDLEKDLIMDEKPKRSTMLDIDPSRVDGYGDPIELITKTRLADDKESYEVARRFTEREYHNMMGGHFGKHSKLIPVFNDDGSKNQIDMVWFSGCPVSIVEDENGKQYYKIRILVKDILLRKLMLTRIPTGHGDSRREEIQVTGAGRMGNDWLKENAPISPMKPIAYNPNKGKTTMKNVGEMIFEP